MRRSPFARTVARSASLRAAAYTLPAPLSSRACTSAAPIPRLAPVTNATAFSIFIVIPPHFYPPPPLLLRERVGAYATPDLLHDEFELGDPPDAIASANDIAYVSGLDEI